MILKELVTQDYYKKYRFSDFCLQLNVPPPFVAKHCNFVKLEQFLVACDQHVSRYPET